MKLSEIVEFNPTTPLRRGTVAPFVDMASLPTTERYFQVTETREFKGSGSKFRDGDTLLARITPCLENGKGGFVRGLGRGVAAHGSTEFIVLRPKKISDADFVYYVTRHPDFRSFAIKQMSGTSGRQRVAWQSLTDYDLVDLTPPERAAIGSLLSAHDDKIEMNRRMNATLEAMARAIFRDWFVDFGPTRAKMQEEGSGSAATGNARIQTREPYLAPDLWPLFPARLDDQGIPEGWQMGTLGDLIEFNPSEPLKKGTPAPYLNMAALPTQGSVADDWLERGFTSGMRFRNGDALLARITPCLENGKAAFIQSLPEGSVGWGSTEFIVMRARPPVPKPFSYLVVRHPEFRRHAIKSMSGTSGRQRTNKEAVEAFPFVIPSEEIWEAFGRIVDPAFEKIRANGEESRILAQADRGIANPRRFLHHQHDAVERLVIERLDGGSHGVRVTGGQ